MPQFSVTSEINVETIRPDSGNFFKLSTQADDLFEILLIRDFNCWSFPLWITADARKNCSRATLGHYQ